MIHILTLILSETRAFSNPWKTHFNRTRKSFTSKVENADQFPFRQCRCQKIRGMLSGQEPAIQTVSTLKLETCIPKIKYEIDSHPHGSLRIWCNATIWRLILPFLLLSLSLSAFYACHDHPSPYFHSSLSPFPLCFPHHEIYFYLCHGVPVPVPIRVIFPNPCLCLVICIVGSPFHSCCSASF